MRNKMIWIIVVVIVLFGALYFAVQAKNKQAIDEYENPYEKDELHQATIDQLDDPLYQNQITPKKLSEKLNNQETATVYFYDPLCKHCLETTPKLVPLADDYEIDLKKLNLREFEDEWDTYDIEGTPTLIHFEEGTEVDRIEGAQSEQVFEQFFKEYIIEEQS